MKKISISVITILLLIGCSKKNNLQDIVKKNMNGLEGTIVFLDLTSNQEIIFNSNLANIRTTPCSTFKIWNTLIGIENNLINSENDPFYIWDGISRPYPDWNKNLTLQEAFKVSCVPAYQNLANKIGLKNMQFWITKLNYGDRDTSSGLDIFWLPMPNKKSILISPKEQAILIKQLINNQLSFSEKALRILKIAMFSKKTDIGIIYGKTGSGKNINNILENNIGWYVGHIISKNGKYAFACLISGKDFGGRHAGERAADTFGRVAVSKDRDAMF